MTKLKSLRNKRREENDMIDAPRKHRGAMAELMACAWLLRNGFEVFRNVSSVGLIDVVAWKDGQFYAFDIKMVQYGITLTGFSNPKIPCLTEEQRKFRVLPLLVTTLGECAIGCENGLLGDL